MFIRAWVSPCLAGCSSLNLFRILETMSAAAPEELCCLGMSACWVRPVAMSYTMGTIMLTGSCGTGIRWVSCSCETDKDKHRVRLFQIMLHKYKYDLCCSCGERPVRLHWDLRKRASWTWAPQRWFQEGQWGEHWEGWWGKTGRSTWAVQPGQGTAEKGKMYECFPSDCQ